MSLPETIPYVNWRWDDLAFLALAGAGYVSPVAAAALHIVSGLIVVFNSARLVRCGEDIEQAEAARAPAAMPVGGAG